MNNRLINSLMLIFGLGMVFSCSKPPEPGICVSLPPQIYLAENLTEGCSVPITVMIPPGAAPTTYSPLPSQMEALYNARVYFGIGHPAFGFENKHILPYLKNNTEIRTVFMADSVELLPDDPHIWLSPSVMKKSARALSGELQSVFPQYKKIIAANEIGILRQIDSVDTEVRNILEPYKGKAFLSYHPAWAYFSRDYGLEQIPVQKEGKSVSSKEISRLLQLSRSRGITIITLQKEYVNRQIDVIARDANLNKCILDPLNAGWDSNLIFTAEKLADLFNEK